MKFIVVTGGVLSGLGKGVTTASIGRILMDRGYDVVPIKIDGYVNVDPGTMNPYEHGEVYVLDDGSETDLDLGHYERFLNMDLDGHSNMTTGQIYETVIGKERRGEYLGKTVQIIPHITDEIKERILSFNTDILVIEVGGTVGDMENAVFIEALRQMAQEQDDFLFIHLSYVPVILSGEQKTKPTQHSVKELLRMGVQPDIIIGRCEDELERETREKIALFGGVEKKDVLSNPDTSDIYQLPMILEKQDLSNRIIKKLNLDRKPTYSFRYEKILRKTKDQKYETTIGIVGKYTGLEDAYLSIKEAFKHAGMKNKAKVNIRWLESEDISPEDLYGFDGILVPGGFGSRGAEGKINAIRYAREGKVPMLGICFGLQCAVIEYARNVCGLEKANSTEIDPETPHPVVDLIPDQENVDKMGGTMRLGAYPCKIRKKTLAYKLYEKDLAHERHRHRWEVNPNYTRILKENDLVISGKYPERDLVEMIELPDHPFFIACQFHPEFKSRVDNPSPLFSGLVKAALKRKEYLT